MSTEVPVVIYVHTSMFLLNVFTNFSSKHFNRKMGNVKKTSRICDQKGSLIFFTTKKLEAMIIKKRKESNVVQIMHTFT